MLGQGAAKKHSSPTDNWAIFFAVLITLGAVIFLDYQGMPQKWHAAILGTVGPFGVVVTTYRLRWRCWWFWTSFAICLVFHCLAMWIVFQYLLANVQSFGMIFWFPMAFIEMFILLFAVAKLNQKFSGEQRPYLY